MTIFEHKISYCFNILSQHTQISYNFTNILFHEHVLTTALKELHIGESFSLTYRFFVNVHFSPTLEPPRLALSENKNSARTNGLHNLFKKYFCIKTVLFERQLEVFITYCDFGIRTYRSGPVTHDSFTLDCVFVSIDWYFSLPFRHTSLVHR